MRCRNVIRSPFAGTTEAGYSLIIAAGTGMRTSRPAAICGRGDREQSPGGRAFLPVPILCVPMTRTIQFEAKNVPTAEMAQAQRILFLTEGHRPVRPVTRSLTPVGGMNY